MPDRWSRTFLFFIGIFIVFCVYKLYETGENLKFVQKHGRLITVPINARIKGSGKVPNKIFVQLNGREYQLRSPRKHFRQTAKLDSIQVAFDVQQNVAVFPDIDVREPYWLLIAILLTGFSIIWLAITGYRS